MNYNHQKKSPGSQTSVQSPSRRERRLTPFENRIPKVRFILDLEPSSYKHGASNQPVIWNPQNAKGTKSILKKDEHPILVDESKLQSSSSICLEADSYDEVELEGTIYKTQNVVQVFSVADRQARGAVDLLTFPTATATIDPLSRFQGSMFIAITMMDKFITHDKLNGYQLDLKEIVNLAHELYLNCQRGKIISGKLFAKSNAQYNKWQKLLARRGEFYIEHTRIKVPMYMQKSMPENVTLYEDLIEDEERYFFDGMVKLFHSSTDLIIASDLDPDLFLKLSSGFEVEQELGIVKEVLKHSQGLVIYSCRQLDKSVTTLSSRIIEEGYNRVRTKIDEVETDVFFDPIVALELKNCLGELVARKSDLLNTTEHIKNYFKWMNKLTKLFFKYTKQVMRNYSSRTTVKKKRCLALACNSCLRYSKVTRENLIDAIPIYSSTNKDAYIVFPMTEDFQHQVFRLLPRSRSQTHVALRSTGQVVQ